VSDCWSTWLRSQFSEAFAIVQDQAHLPNERISLSNLQRGMSVIERFLLKAADKSMLADPNVAPSSS
jgi:hypothetical protein